MWVTFTAKDETETAQATMETANAEAENSKFLYYNEAVIVSFELFDHTNSGTTHYSTRLNGTTNEQTGLAKSVSVMPGDVVKAEVYAKYLDATTSNWTTALANFIAAITNGTAPAGTVIDGEAIGSTGGVPASFGSLLDKSSETGDAPKAYLNYLVFDRNYKVLDGGFVRVTEAAKESGADGNHEKLAKEIEIKEAGYVYLYLSNDNVALGGSAVEVYFDDFKVEHVKSPVVQVDDYYPFGLTYNSYQRENNLANDWKFQSQQHIDDLDLGWDSFKWRNHQPEIGRFFNIDPLAEKYYYNSPYAFSENKVVAHGELEGLESVLLITGNDMVDAMNSSEPTTPWWNFTKDMSREPTDKIQEGIGVNIVDEGKGAPDNIYLPSPDPNSPNFDMEKALLDAFSAMGESLNSPSAKDIGQRAESLATGAEKTNGAMDAAKDVVKDGDKVQHKPDTLYGTKTDAGSISNYYIVIDGKDTIPPVHHVPGEIPKNAKRVNQ